MGWHLPGCTGGAGTVLDGTEASRDLLESILAGRLWVARLGEGDRLGWWRTDGVLGPDGAFVGPRLLPRTHPTARARIAFAVARHACDERHPDPNAYHLFRLDPEIEDRLDALLAERVGADGWWRSVLSRIEALGPDVDPVAALVEAGIVAEEDIAQVRRLSLGPGGRSLAVENGSAERTLRQLVAGFTRSRAGELVVPWIRGAA